MPSQYSSQPLLQTDPNLQKLLATLTSRFQGAGNVPQYGDTQGAFDAFANAARGRQGAATDYARQAAMEQAAASGKTFSSSALNKIAEVGQRGELDLAALLGEGSLRLQDTLSRQAEGRAAAGNTRDELATRLLGSIGSVSSGSSGPAGPTFEQLRRAQLEDAFRERTYQLQDRAAADAEMRAALQRGSVSAPTPPKDPILEKYLSMLSSRPQAGDYGGMGSSFGGGSQSIGMRGTYGDYTSALSNWQLLMDQIAPMLGGERSFGPTQVGALSAMNAGTAGAAAAASPIYQQREQQAFLDRLAKQDGPGHAVGGGRGSCQ